MSGGIVQLVATGAQDAWLSGKPEVSFYRSNYKRYTHYASSVERQIIQGAPVAGGMSTVRFEKKGDLLSYSYLTARDATGATVSTLNWQTVIDKIELVIGGQVIDTQDLLYMSNVEPVTGAASLNQRLLPLPSSTAVPTNSTAGFLPLKFFFCKDWQSALPLVALQYHDIELRITWASTLGAAFTPPGGSATTTAALQYSLWSNFVYLDQAEREYFATKPQDMLITQVQRQFIPPSPQNMMEMAFAHPVKFLAFTSNSYSTAYVRNATNASTLQFKTQVNGVDIGESKSLIQWVDVPQYYHTQYGYNPSAFTANVAIIPFCLDTAKLQPTGTLNFSRIDTFRIVTPAGTSLQSVASSDVQAANYVYAVNYNVLRVKDGMAGLLYSN